MNKVFADTSFFVAFANQRDAWHELAVMQEQGLTEALTTDHHFQQAGFQILLKH